MKMSRPGRFTRDSGLGNGPRGLPPKTPVKTIPTGGPVQGQRLSTTPEAPDTGPTPEQAARMAAMKASLSSAQPQQVPSMASALKTQQAVKGMAQPQQVPTLAGALKSGTLQNAPKTMASMPQHVTKAMGMKKGGSVKSSASKRGDGCAQRGKTKGRMV